MTKKDWCTFWFEGNWWRWCRGHDYDYADGGSRGDRKIADIKLMAGVVISKHPWIAMLMYTGVRLFGWTRWRKHGRST